MATVSRTTLKNWFKKGLKPLESQFASWIDSFWHKDDAIPIGSVEGLQDVLNSLPSSATTDQILAALQTNDANLDTLQEIIDYIKGFDEGSEIIALINTALGYDINTVITGKADKVAGATAGNFAGLDVDGNLVDLGSNPADKVSVSQIVNDLVTGGTQVPLSAEQGKTLKELIDGINLLLASDDTSLDTIQEIVNLLKSIDEGSEMLALINTALGYDLATAIAGKAEQTTTETRKHKTITPSGGTIAIDCENLQTIIATIDTVITTTPSSFTKSNDSNLKHCFIDGEVTGTVVLDFSAFTDIVCSEASGDLWTWDNTNKQITFDAATATPFEASIKKAKTGWILRFDAIVPV